MKIKIFAIMTVIVCPSTAALAGDYDFLPKRGGDSLVCYNYLYSTTQPPDGLSPTLAIGPMHVLNFKKTRFLGLGRIFEVAGEAGENILVHFAGYDDLRIILEGRGPSNIKYDISLQRSGNMIVGDWCKTVETATGPKEFCAYVNCP